MKYIMSLNNPEVKEWRKLKKKKNRQKKGIYLIEGFHLIEEAMLYDRESLKRLILREDLVEESEVQAILRDINEAKLVVVTREIADGISATQSNQGIFAEMEISSKNILDTIKGPFLLLDAVQDPGNVGTMIRTADAAGFQAVVLGKGTVDLYNDKTLRSAQGSHFHLSIYEMDLLEFIPDFQKQNYPVFATELSQEAQSYKEIKVEEPFSLIVGNEGAGIRDEIAELVDQNIYIPMKGHTESLNVAIAASILMFHLN
ncbi:MAG: RNA methyltransferase [Atopostipes sp.]|nr:RNA methyltransferase [Atopostipes sp.]